MGPGLGLLVGCVIIRVFSSEDILPLIPLKISLMTISFYSFLQIQTYFDGHNDLQILFVILILQNTPLKLY